MYPSLHLLGLFVSATPPTNKKLTNDLPNESDSIWNPVTAYRNVCIYDTNEMALAGYLTHDRQHGR